MRIPDLKKRIVTKQCFGVADFRTRYLSVRGTALGLAHTLRQTSLLRPNNWNKRVEQLYYVGGNTVPGIGMPICLISAELVLKRILGKKDGSALTSLQ
jgi:phytoene dehydrogenase-like protein